MTERIQTDVAAATALEAGASAIPAKRLSAGELLRAYSELSKARLSAMVVVTTALGYIVGSRSNLDPSHHGFDFLRLMWTCVGTFLAAAGAAAFNQAIEARRDKLMKRTQDRPIPSGRISRAHAAFFGLLASIAGVGILCPTSNGLTAILATANILIYALIYTPLKPISSLNTIVGAVVGAIPPMMGWSAATDSLAIGAWVLGGILFVWQIPHFLALAWMYRLDYAKGGYKMVSTIDPSGRLTSMLAFMYSLALIPLCLCLCSFGYAGMPFAMVSSVLGLLLILLAMRFMRSRSNVDARRLFLATILYLPLLCLVLIVGARGPFDQMTHTRNGYFTANDSGQVVDPGVAK